jgi:hypothetical protein
MPTHSSIKHANLLSFMGFSPSSKRFLSLLRCALLACLLSLSCLPGLPINSAIAMPVADATAKGVVSQVADSTTEGARMTALIACLPKQLSQPSLERAWSEMGDDQLERALNLKVNPKLSQAEIELKDCMSRKGFTN